MRVRDLRPGDIVRDPTKPDILGHTFIIQTEHPLYPKLRLVLWRMDDRSWSHDALSIDQDVGQVVFSTSEERRTRLREAFRS